MSPMVVVAGRPNVGKSSLVNRIVGGRETVVEEEHEAAPSSVQIAERPA